MDSRSKQLGINKGTAANRLVKDILFSFVQKECPNCFRCQKPMSRKDFSIEHKVPWANSDDPLGLFFDLENITFSHLKCNSAAAKRKVLSQEVREENNRVSRRNSARKHYTPEKRRQKYLRTGK